MKLRKCFLDTQIIKENNKIKSQVFAKKTMHSAHCFSKVLLRYYAINGELHRGKKIASSFQLEAARIKTKFVKNDFPRKVIENTIGNFNNAG